MVKVNAVLARLDRTLAGVHAAELSDEARGTLANINSAVTKLNAILERASSDDGVLASAERASLAVGDVARNADGVGEEMEVTLRAVQDAAGSIQRLTDALERDSDMLL